MMVLLIFVLIGILIFLIFINGLISRKFEEIAKEKGHANVPAFALCFWFGVLGMIYVIALPDRTLIKEIQNIKSLLLNHSSENISSQNKATAKNTELTGISAIDKYLK